MASLESALERLGWGPSFPAFMFIPNPHSFLILNLTQVVELEQGISYPSLLPGIQSCREDTVR